MPSTPGISGQLFDTVGLEVEGTLLDREKMMGEFMPKLAKLMGKNFSKLTLDRDASTESLAENINLGRRTLKISSHTKAYDSMYLKGSGENRLYGYEFKTSPIELPEVEKIMYPLVYCLYEYGDVISDRSSIHMHTGFANNFRMLKSLLTIMLSLEPVLYRLGGMGGTFRGHLNNAAYCRPLLNSCVVPVAKLGNKTYVQVMNPLAALDADNISDFWAAMGVAFEANSQHKYHCSRYSGMNFFSLYSHGTAEWRYFNKSFDVPLIVGITKFMRAVVETSSLVNMRDLSRYQVIDSNKEISVGDAESVLGMTLALCHEKGVNNIPTDAEMSHILDVLKESHFIPLPEAPVMAHIKDFAVNEEIVKRGHLKVVKDYLPTNYVDIHTIKMMSIFS